MAELAAELEAIDAEILRLHTRAIDENTEALQATLDLAQIDALLERRYSLWPKVTDDRGEREATAR